MGNNCVHLLVGRPGYLHKVLACDQHLVVVDWDNACRLLKRTGQGKQDVVVLQDHFSLSVRPDSSVEDHGLREFISHLLYEMSSKSTASATSQRVEDLEALEVVLPLENSLKALLDLLVGLLVQIGVA